MVSNSVSALTVADGNQTYHDDHFVIIKIQNHYLEHLKLI